MNKYLNAGLAIAAFCAMIGSAAASGEETVSETRSVDARAVRVKLDGAIDLTLRQGPVPSLAISGDKRRLEQTTVSQLGDTLSIGSDTRGFKMHRKRALHAELTLPNLRAVSSESVGRTDIRGFSGDELDLSLEGAGSMNVNCNYRIVTASLGGVGSMNIEGVDGQTVDLNLHGAGYVTLRGRSKWLKATLGGLGGLDAQHFQADTVDLDLSGLGNASVSARENANLNLSGMGSVTVYGKPVNRNVSVDGLGKVNWK